MLSSNKKKSYVKTSNKNRSPLSCSTLGTEPFYPKSKPRKKFLHFCDSLQHSRESNFCALFFRSPKTPVEKCQKHCWKDYNTGAAKSYGKPGRSCNQAKETLSIPYFTRTRVIKVVGRGLIRRGGGGGPLIEIGPGFGIG
ncbi:hypothetical protein JTE90_020587 [Oedothorax gibbosus]|uniref:Uncharacterized protein n=1 Tax=Oedothorax gibbosus TaxID=931172 RepID=A0AAV6VY01_9ARAC|nr:hypothetical protein JTE90_020587 [Oedothorax gibbosus]